MWDSSRDRSTFIVSTATVFQKGLITPATSNPYISL
jgi:hypothetical protein